MATLVLTAVGGAVGGPIGAAIGSVVGQAVDRTVLLAPKRREGPRLSELRLQTSSYGTQIPKLFGTLRVAGTVIWATDLIESRSTSRAGKGQPSVAQYSYSASFAVLLSARPIRGVGRIWAEGKLLRGAAGDWKGATGFRLHLGGEDQAVDPLIASAVGAALAPAHRGCAYAVFEGMQLADYGNRIPSLTFEVIADEGAVTPGAIAAGLAPEVMGDAGRAIGGFAAAGGSVGAVLETLARIGGGWWAVDGGGVVLSQGGGEPVAVVDAGVSAGGGDPRRARTTAPLETVPRVLSVSHYDPARDYQMGVQRARRPGAGSREERVEVPAVLAAGEAKAIADAMLLRAETERVRRVVATGLAGWAIRPGQQVSVTGEAGRWRVAASAIEGMAARLSLVPVATSGVTPVSADSGRVVGAEDLAVGTTLLAAFELPGLDEVPLSQPRVTVVAAGTGPGWRGAALLYSLDGGESWLSAGSTAAPGTIGTVVSGPGAGPATLVDEVAAVEVALANGGMVLADADDRQLDAGANLALVGDELVQFGHAAPLGGDGWRLTRLLRGRRGTEAAIGLQRPGDRFVLLEAGTTRTLDLSLAGLGGIVRVMATGIGDEAGPQVVDVPIVGASVLPFAPTSLTAERRDGAVRLRWIRRSRAGWNWPDGADVPLGEEAERYRVTVMSADGGVRRWEPVEPSLTLSEVEAGPAPLKVRVSQIGTHGESPAIQVIVKGTNE